VTFADNGDGTATIAGTPTGSAKGVYTLVIKARSSAGTVTQTFTLTVNRAPSLSAITTKTASIGTAFSMTAASTAYPTATMSESGALPSGLSFTDNGDGTATLSGTPAVGSGGAYSVTITATNSVGVVSQSFTLRVNEGPVITSVASASAIVGTPFSFAVTSTGYPAPTVTKSGTLPAGVTWNGTTDTFSGTPHAGTAGTYTITLTAHNTTGTVTQTLTVT
jgi:hypothetical protein